MRIANHLSSAAIGTIAVGLLAAAPASAQGATAPADGANSSDGDEIVVTAQKRSESINRVGMSITAVSGDDLLARGALDTAQLAKVVPGFVFNNTVYGAPVYTIRGVGFQESSLAASPTVSVYVDEIPLPFPAETLGASLDIERVEVLKGPQGTLYGQNSTGGAVNYIAAKPTDKLELGVNGSFGRFNTADISGFVSGPLSSTLQSRLSARYVRADGWQQSVSRPGDKLGRVDQLFGRLLTEWEPSAALKFTLNINGWRDHSDSPAVQLSGLDPQLGFALLPPAVAALSPVPAGKARLADWNAGTSFRRDNSFYQISLRGDLSLSDTTTVTSISSYQKYDRNMPVDADGTQFPVFQVAETGEVETFFQELRLAGALGEGHWMLGVNYQSDKTRDSHFIDFSSASSFILGGKLVNENSQDMKTKAVYANFDYPIIDRMTLQAGIRYTEADRDYVGCGRDPGDGGIASALDGLTGGIFGYAAGQCFTLLDAGMLGLARKSLDEDNVSWRIGLNYQVQPEILLYANVSKGYKAGSFPILSALTESQIAPVTQESLVAYETGFKASIGRAVQINGAFFHYDYRNKQIRGLTVTALGLGETLLNIPKSHVTGFELNGIFLPFQGLRIAPSITLVDSKIDGNFTNFDGFAQNALLSGEAFPNTPKWQGNTDIEYRFPVGNFEAFLGSNISYQTKSNGLLGANPEFAITGYALVDLRAGVEGPAGQWSTSIWGRNVTDKYYIQTAVRSNDTLIRYAGMPATYGISFSFRY